VIKRLLLRGIDLETCDVPPGDIKSPSPIVTDLADPPSPFFDATAVPTGITLDGSVVQTSIQFTGCGELVQYLL